MNKFLRVVLSGLFFVFVVQFSAYAQNCTINAGVNRIICPPEPFALSGTATGLFTDKATWTQIAGPAVTVSATTQSGSTALATVTGFTKNIAYTFRLTAKCGDGTPISNDVVITYSPLTVSDAGPSITACPGTVTMAANALQAGETGTWAVVSGDLPLPSPSNSPTATVTLPQNSSGTTIYRWRITANDCVSTSDVSVTNTGGVQPVTASGPGTVNCYTLTGSANISGSYAGSGNGQSGTWSFVSGPGTPVFGNIHNNNTSLSNLTGGTYVVRWTVAGPCVNGSADVTINVENPSQDVTKVSGTTLTYCDGRTSTVLNGTRPLYTNETVQWAASASNPGGAVIVNPTSPTTTINGLVPNKPYDFNYTITNSVTHCTSSGVYHIRYVTPPQIVTFPASPQVLATDTTSYNIVYSTSGGNSTQWALVSSPAGSKILDSIGLNTYRDGGATSQLVKGMDKPGTYVYRFRRSSTNTPTGCDDAYKDLSIVVSRTPFEANAGTDQYLDCGVTTATLAGNDPQPGDNGVGTWSQLSGPNKAIIVNIHSNATIITGLISGVYTFRWIISGGNNVLDDTESDVDVIVASLPTTVNAGADIESCFATPMKLNGNMPRGNETGTWSVVSEFPGVPASNITFSNIHDPDAVIRGLLPYKTYIIRWTISNSCGATSDDVKITTNVANGPKQATAGPDQCLPSGTK